MKNINEIAKVLNKGGVAVIPTDTVYGLVAKAFDVNAVNKLYLLKNRSPDKQCIVLIADFEQLKLFGIEEEWAEIAKKYWPGPFSLIFPTIGTEAAHLIKDTGTIALRLPKDDGLRRLIRQTGPLVAPSANPEDQPPAKNIEEAKAYFGNRVDIYVDGGDKSKFLPSSIINLATEQTIR